MALGGAGGLVVSLALDATQYFTGLEKSKAEAKKFAQSMEENGRVIGRAFGLGIAAAGTALFVMTKNAIDAADKLNDLSKSTGVSVETLGGLGFAAKQSGTDLEGVAKSIGKLSLQIAAATAGDETAAEAFHALGISMKELRENSPDQILAKIATQFATYEDGPNKAALANRLFGKSYQSIIPLLDEGGQKLQAQIAYYQKYGGVTTDVAKQADEFNDTLNQLGLISSAFSRNLSAALLPSLQGVAKEMLSAKEQGDGFKGAAEGVATVLKTLAIGAVYAGTAIESVGTVIRATADQMVALSHLDFKAYARIQDDASAYLDELTKRRTALVAAINNTNVAPSASASAGTPKQRQAPGLPRSGAAADAAAEAKKILDQQIKEQENAIRAERDLLSDREHYLQAYYEDNTISLKAYYANTKRFQDEALQNTLAAYDREIEAARAFAAKAKPADRIDAETKVADMVAKRARVQQEADMKAFDSLRMVTRETEAYNDAIAELSAQILVMSGNERAAAELRFDIQNRGIRGKMMAEGDTAGIANLDRIRAQAAATAELGSAARDYQQTVSKLGIEQARVDLERQAGAISELEAINKRSALATSYIATLTAEANEYERIAQTLQGVAKDDALLKVQQMRLEIDALKVSANALSKTFNDIFGTAFADALVSVVDGTKSASAAFRDMEKQIVAAISRIAAQEIASKIFGIGGATGGGIGDFFAKLFGAAAGGLGGGGAPAWPNAGSGMAGGGSPPIGRATLVGERGPELFVPKVAGTIVPNDKIGVRRGNLTVITNVNVLPGASRASANQAAAAVGLEVRRAMARNT